MLNEISPSQKDKYSVIPLIGGNQSGQNLETERRKLVARAWGQNGELVVNGDRVSVWEDEELLEICCTTIWI